MTTQDQPEPRWCNQSSPHGIHVSTAVIVQHGPGRWHVSLGQTDGAEHAHLTLVYLGETARADRHWSLPLDAAADYADFASRLGDPEIAAAITSTAALELVSAA